MSVTGCAGEHVMRLDRRAAVATGFCCAGLTVRPAVVVVDAAADAAAVVVDTDH